jgi:hypothetical protein
MTTEFTIRYSPRRGFTVQIDDFQGGTVQARMAQAILMLKTNDRVAAQEIMDDLREGAKTGVKAVSFTYGSEVVK